MVCTVALVLAGGRGIRAGGAIPKQYRAIGGVAMMRHALAAFVAHPRIDAVGAVIHPDDEALYREAAAGLDLLEPVFGGPTRQVSGYNGLRSIGHLGPEYVLLQDAARPFTSAATIDRVLDGLGRSAACLAAMPVTDTIKRADGRNIVVDTVARDGLWRAQTPQGFRYRDILNAHAAAEGKDLTDDAAVAEAAGMQVELVMGDEENLKVTTDEDFRRAERIASMRGGPVASGEFRVGCGYDVHRFESGDRVHLCGVAIPHRQKLRGHSDADAGLHAVTDAVLGAIGEGDIGDHFPPSDPRWKDADSAIFLAKAVDMVASRGGTIVNLDVTIICEQPRIGSHRQKMRERLAAICGIDVSRVSVKATTTEKLGFTGREEGIAAQAVATVRL